MRDKVQTAAIYAACVFLFCYFLRIFHMPNELTVIAGGVLCLMLAVQQKRIRIDLGIGLLAVSLVSYYVILHGIEGLFYSIAYIPLVIYMLANYLAGSTGGADNREKDLMLLIFILLMGYSLHGLLNSYMWYAGYGVPGTRRWPDFWSGEIVPGTQHAAYFIPAMALFVPALLYFKKRKWMNMMVILLTAFFGYTALSTRSRMTILIFIITVFVQCVMYAGFEWETTKKQLKNKWLYILFGIVLAVMILGFIAVKDTPVVAAFINNLGKDGGILNNVRFTAQRLAIKQIFDYPMGGYQMDLGKLEMTHNTWLDMANAAGVIPFLAFFAYTGYSLYNMMRTLLAKNVTTEIKLMIMGLYVSFLLYLAVEPVLEASIHLLTPWIFVNGLVCEYTTKERVS